MKDSFTTKEKILYSIWLVCGILVRPLYFVANWAINKLNKSYYKNLK